MVPVINAAIVPWFLDAAAKAHSDGEGPPAGAPGPPRHFVEPTVVSGLPRGQRL